MHQAVSGSECPEFLVFKLNKTSPSCADPEVPLTVLKECSDLIIFYLCCVSLVKNSEMDTIKKGEASSCAEPDISIARLDYGSDGVMGKAILGLPHLVNILGDGFGRVKGLSGDNKKKKE
jgi:hypothetical protein